MYDPKFEKAVQRRMEELEFRPSESVWVNIEKAVTEQRRRRAIPFFWRLLVPAALLTAAAGAYYFGERAGRREVGKNVQPAQQTEMTTTGKLGRSGTEKKILGPGNEKRTEATRQVNADESSRQAVAVSHDPKLGSRGESGTSRSRGTSRSTGASGTIGESGSTGESSNRGIQPERRIRPHAAPAIGLCPGWKISVWSMALARPLWRGRRAWSN